MQVGEPLWLLALIQGVGGLSKLGEEPRFLRDFSPGVNLGRGSCDWRPMPHSQPPIDPHRNPKWFLLGPRLAG